VLPLPLGCNEETTPQELGEYIHSKAIQIQNSTTQSMIAGYFKEQPEDPTIYVGFACRELDRDRDSWVQANMMFVWGWITSVCHLCVCVCVFFCGVCVCVFYSCLRPCATDNPGRPGHRVAILLAQEPPPTPAPC
jgi:hypothetical protein